MHDRSHRSEPARPSGDREQLEQLSLFPTEVDMGALRKLRDRATLSVPLNTLKGLETDWRMFEEWCESAGRRALPASSETVELFAVHCVSKAGLRVATVTHRLWAIARTHKVAGHASPIRDSVRAVMAGLSREHGSSQRQKSAVTLDELRAMVATLDRFKRGGVRDRALLLVGFSTGLRSADLVALRDEDLRITELAAEVRVRREKTDQAGRGRVLGMVRGPGPLDAVAALENWIRIRGKHEGLLFGVQVKWVWSVVKRTAKAAGLDPAQFGSHSLRAGMITALDDCGVSIPVIMARSGHKSYDMVARYVRRRDALTLDPLNSVARKSGSGR
jgi:integrase